MSERAVLLTLPKNRFDPVFAEGKRTCRKTASLDPAKQILLGVEIESTPSNYFQVL
jgi:hypothetical protein